MKSVTVTWRPEAERFDVEGTHLGHVIAVNAPGGPVTGFSASELLLAGAGSCSAWDVIGILRKSRQDLHSLEVQVRGEQASEPPWAYTRLTLRYVLRGTQLSRRAVARAVRLSVERYCSVLATVAPSATIEREIELHEEAPRSAAGANPAAESARANPEQEQQLART